MPKPANRQGPPRKGACRRGRSRKGRKPKVSKETIEEIFRRFQAADPEPKGELEHLNPYTLLVAVVLSAQATDAGVNKATRPLFKAADTPEEDGGAGRGSRARATSGPSGSIATRRRT